MSVSTLPIAQPEGDMKHISHGGLVASALLQSVAKMELSGPNLTVNTNDQVDAGPSNASNNKFIDNLKDFFSSSPKTQDPKRVLHNPKNVEEFVTLLQRPDTADISVNERNHQGDAPLHSLVKKKKQIKHHLLLALLMHSDVNINLGNDYGNTALHLAAESGDLQTIKLLLSFGANINALNSQNKTPLDLIEGPYRLYCRQDSTIRDFTLVDHELTCTSPTVEAVYDLTDSSPATEISSATKSSKKPVNHRQQSITYYGETLQLSQFMKDHGAVRGKDLKNKYSLYKNKKPVHPFLDVVPAAKEGTNVVAMKGAGKTLIDCAEKQTEWTQSIPRRYYLLTSAIESKLRNVNVSLFDNADEGLALAVQMKELKMLQEAGSRILFLDGGGLRGLIQIEILSQLEEQTGRQITELFDWIVGTSTGGIIALAMVYAKKTLKELRQLYFKLREDVFGKSRLGMTVCDTDNLESILKNEFGDMRMCDVKYPRVLVPAVNKSTISLKLHFFNNCFGDEFSKEEVWKVARHTSAAPILFNESDNYVDGGMLANNPSANGLTKIQDFYRQQEQRLPISLVVSVGSGKLPEDKLGNVDVQDFLVFGKHWFTEKLLSRVENLKILLGNAVVEGEHIAENVRSRCLEQGISYYRLNTQLSTVISSGETDTDILTDMILLTKATVIMQGTFSKLVLQFHQCSEANRKMTRRFHTRPVPVYKLQRSPAFRRQKCKKASNAF